MNSSFTQLPKPALAPPAYAGTICYGRVPYIQWHFSIPNMVLTVLARHASWAHELSAPRTVAEYIDDGLALTLRRYMPKTHNDCWLF